MIRLSFIVLLVVGAFLFYNEEPHPNSWWYFGGAVIAWFVCLSLSRRRDVIQQEREAAYRQEQERVWRARWAAMSLQEKVDYLAERLQSVENNLGHIERNLDNLEDRLFFLDRPR